MSWNYKDHPTPSFHSKTSKMPFLTMSSPTTPTITITTVSDKTTVVEQPREESPFPLPIPPPQSMSLPFTFTSTTTHYFPMIPSDKEFMPPRDDESETELSKTAYSRSQTPSPESMITNLMNFIVDATINRIPTPAEIARATITAMAPTFQTRDMMIHHLSSTTGLLTPEQCDSITQELDEFADVARESGLPLIPQEIIDRFLERTRPQETAPDTATEDVTTITHNPTIVTIGGTIVPIATTPVAIDTTTTTAPACFTMAMFTNLINASEDLDSRPSSPDIPYAPNTFPFEYNRQDDDNFNIPPPTIILIDGILEHYNIPTWRDTAMHHTFYHIWTLLTSWTFVNNYLHILNQEIRVDLITVVNNFINLT